MLARFVQPGEELGECFRLDSILFVDGCVTIS